MDSRPLAHKIKESADIIGVSVSQLYQLAKDGKLRIIRVAGVSLIERSELERLISEARTAPSEIATGRAVGAYKVHAIRAERARTESPGAALARRRRRGRPAQSEATTA